MTTKVTAWLPRNVAMEITAHIKTGDVDTSGLFTCDCYAIFLVGSPAWTERRLSMMPVGNIAFEGKKYSIYIR